ncbi:MAG: transcriptional repressor [Candidatus Eisenbacteria bacterium]|uniref:Transcriptional repressor n=1 Tax=Eiseniibacteriota bacterium TaxID=2212470 RepID=A0A937XB30_UNCEI|nr:transcriptional repressor [Candidatus Eisenbacteria bacterium]
MHEPAADYAQNLRQAGIKVTRIRLAILELIALHGRYMTADEITGALRERAVPADRVTIYRNIDRMVHAGLMVAACMPGKAMRVGVCSRPAAPHHHHILCERCGRVSETSGCPILDARERLAGEILETSGFVLTDHTAQYMGICSDCRAARS